MGNDIAEFIGATVLIVIGVAVVAFVISLPFAFIGFIVLAAANVFSAGVVITYFSSCVVGFVASIIIGILSN